MTAPAAPDFAIDVETRTLRVGRSETRVDPIVARLLSALAEAEGALLTKDALIEAVWRRKAVTDDAILKSVSKARAALAAAGPGVPSIETVRGVGYRLVAANVALPVQRRVMTGAVAGAAVLSLAALAAAFFAMTPRGPTVIHLDKDDPVRVIRNAAPLEPNPTADSKDQEADDED